MQTGMPITSPFSGLNTIDDLSRLSYFEALACLGGGSFHCGGIKNTGHLLSMANINKHASILEIGCGTGATTISLILSGFNVTVIEPSERMINAMTRNCMMYTGRLIEQYNIPAEEMDMLNAERFDVVLLECVFGFIKDKHKAIYEITRVLKPKGIIAITDFHYTKEPPLNLKNDLKEMFGIGNTLAKKDWVNYFDEREPIKWEPVATVQEVAR